MVVQAAGVPGITDGGDREWFVPAGGRDRRPVRVGDHIATDHPLVLEYPDHFVPSVEPVDCWPVGVLSEDARKRQEAERQRLAPSLARRVVPICSRCGASSEESVVMVDPPGAMDLHNALVGLDGTDAAGRYRVEREVYARARLAQARKQELAAAERRWAEQHTACPEGTPPAVEPLCQPPCPCSTGLRPCAATASSANPEPPSSEAEHERQLADHDRDEHADLRVRLRQRGAGHADGLACRHHHDRL
jgi:hypothetical protein